MAAIGSKVESTTATSKFTFGRSRIREFNEAREQHLMYICEGSINEYKLLTKSPQKDYLTKLKYWVEQHQNKDGKG